MPVDNSDFLDPDSFVNRMGTDRDDEPEEDDED